MVKDGANRDKSRLTIVIPAYNEEKRLPGTLPAIGSYFKSLGRPYRVLVVDDGSTDQTAAVARGFSADMPVTVLSYRPNRGKGYAVRQGLAAAGGDPVLMTDADLSTPIAEFSKLEAAVRSGAGMAIGSRDLPDSQVEVHQPWYREQAGKTFNRMIRSLGIVRFRDTQCGFKLLTPECAAAIIPHLTVDRFAFDVEMVVVAGRLGIKVVEVPVVWVNSPESKVRLFSDAFIAARDVALIRWRAWTGGFPRKEKTR